MLTTLQSHEEPLHLGAQFKGDSGRIYRIEEVLADRRKPLLCVYRARTAESADEGEYVIKNMIPGEFEYQLDLQKQLAACPNLRSVVDTIPDLGLFIYPFLTGDLLHIKANNILVDYDESIQGEIIIKKVQISDLEDAVLVPPGKWLRGPLCGNAIWRSPESWCRSRQNQASDMIYVMLNEMVFRVRDCELHASDSWRYVLRRHISYFADEQGFAGLLEHIGESNAFHGRLITLAGDFTSESPREPFESWNYVEPEFRDLVGKMTNLDPNRRITAREALEHRWFTQAT
ncbi:hypothetical protein P175DRAFT_0514365 [Aspergillus ochraceoroseus IBT 24754]|uniref:Protein kinase domain-containing protein n=1 Tax=Aspergillus ochraceoroseus IBT 24754 TaxID=1392256 RepID=A0A2T5M137_9EURO|nr:uncharacterized protein P175DRAFT_0514365 [Aspergillus ochraceoroseus IBT 24754]PTU22237.1 hypothetical protein P175DRAFT_0514365 [Aspergillus ochraceoroseus IBT 24754]